MLNVVIVGSWNVNPGFRLVDRPEQPAFLVSKNLSCDVFLGAHGSYFKMLEKLDRLHAGSTDDVWMDPQGNRAALAEREAAFEAELLRQEGSAESAYKP